jgi:hypothetical protein
MICAPARDTVSVFSGIRENSGRKCCRPTSHEVGYVAMRSPAMVPLSLLRSVPPSLRLSLAPSLRLFLKAGLSGNAFCDDNIDGRRTIMTMTVMLVVF